MVISANPCASFAAWSVVSGFSDVPEKSWLVLLFYISNYIMFMV